MVDSVYVTLYEETSRAGRCDRQDGEEVRKRMTNSSNVRVEAIHSRLDERLAHGRTPVEAGGEVRWLIDAEQRMGVLSNQTTSDVHEICDAWVAAKVGVPLEEAREHVLLARLYADFLARPKAVQLARLGSDRGGVEGLAGSALTIAENPRARRDNDGTHRSL
jgi:hypothetical protein